MHTNRIDSIRKSHTKPVQPAEKVVESLMNLREELLGQDDLKSREIVFKINSCLFSEYPHAFQGGVKND